MPLTLIATPNPATGSVLLTVAGGTPPYAVTAIPTGRAEYVTRSPSIDGDVPLNTPTIYVARDAAGGSAIADAVTVHAFAPVLSSATDPGSGFQVVVVSQLPNRWEARTKWWDVLGRAEPFVSTGPMRLRSGALVLRAANTAQRNQLFALLLSGAPLLLRGTDQDFLDDIVMAVEQVAESLVMDETPGGPRLFELTYQGVSRELGETLGGGRTYTTLLLEAPTYADLLAMYASYTAVRTGAA